MSEIVRGEYDRSKRLQVITNTDEERRAALNLSQKETEKQPEYQEGRRNVLNWIVGIFGLGFVGTALYPAIRFAIPPEKKTKISAAVVVAKASEIPANSGKIVKFNNDAVLVVNKNGDYTAMSAVCTHLGCKVQWVPKDQDVWCACHGAKYNEVGEKISGPQPANLTKFNVKVQDGNLVVSKA